MDEGWTRWVFEQYGIPFVSVTDSVIRAGNLRAQLDVLIFPDLSGRSIVSGYSQRVIPSRYAGGIGEAGANHVVTFVRAGGQTQTLSCPRLPAPWHLILAAMLFSIIFEGIMPTIDSTATRDPADIIAYLSGGILVYLVKLS